MPNDVGAHLWILGPRSARLPSDLILRVATRYRKLVDQSDSVCYTQHTYSASSNVRSVNTASSPEPRLETSTSD